MQEELASLVAPAALPTAMIESTIGPLHPFYPAEGMLEAALMGDLSREAIDSFDQILRQREAQVLRTAFRIVGNWADAEDVAQEVFLRLHRHGTDFANEGAFGAWLYRVTVNLCLDRARSSRPVVELPELPCQDLSAEE